MNAEAIEQTAADLRSAAEPTRLLILGTLAEGERSVGGLCEAIGKPQASVSNHLAVLRHCRLIQARYQGRSRIYSLTERGRSMVAAVEGM